MRVPQPLLSLYRTFPMTLVTPWGEWEYDWAAGEWKAKEQNEHSDTIAVDSSGHPCESSPRRQTGTPDKAESTGPVNRA